jgi:hypothetical protein
MQTAWRHSDPESQREFERIRKQKTGTTTIVAETPAPSAPANVPTINVPVKEYELRSPLNTISINTQKSNTKVIWDIDRFLTVSVDNIEIPTRIYDPYHLNYRFDTVKHIDFVGGKNIKVYGHNVEEDKVSIHIEGTAPTTSSLDGALSTVWIKDANGDFATGFGYDTVSASYLNSLMIGPWGWQNAINSTTPYTASNYSNNAKDTEWDWGTSIRANPLHAYTRFGKVSKAGLYWVYMTTQGYRWASTALAANMTPFINTRVFYYCMVRRGGLAPKIYKSLDVMQWDMWTWPTVGVDLEGRTLFVNRMSSLPWSLNGGCLVWLNVDDEVGTAISYYNGNGGEARFGYQVTYHAFEAVLVADNTTLDPATQVNLTPINDPDVFTNYHNMQFTNV